MLYEGTEVNETEVPTIIKDYVAMAEERVSKKLFRKLIISWEPTSCFGRLSECKDCNEGMQDSARGHGGYSTRSKVFLTYLWLGILGTTCSSIT